MLDVPAFIETFEDFARAESVRVVQADVTTSRYDFYDQAVITLELEGDERRIDELEAKVSGLARIVHWRTVSEEPEEKRIAHDLRGAPAAGRFRSRPLSGAEGSGEHRMVLALRRRSTADL